MLLLEGEGVELVKWRRFRDMNLGSLKSLHEMTDFSLPGPSPPSPVSSCTELTNEIAHQTVLLNYGISTRSVPRLLL